MNKLFNFIVNYTVTTLYAYGVMLYVEQVLTLPIAITSESILTAALVIWVGRAILTAGDKK